MANTPKKLSSISYDIHDDLSLSVFISAFSISFLYLCSPCLAKTSIITLRSSINRVKHLSVTQLTPSPSRLAWFPVLSNVGFPIMWAYLICNMFTQYFCIRSVFILTTECSSLVVTLVITLRKFVSLLISIVYFHNEFTFYHSVGTACVFLGTFLFSNVQEDISRFLRRTHRDWIPFSF